MKVALIEGSEFFVAPDISDTLMKFCSSCHKITTQYNSDRILNKGYNCYNRILWLFRNFSFVIICSCFFL